MNLFTMIVLPTDFSESAGAAVPYAVALAKTYGAKITIVHVFEELRTLGMHGRDMIDRAMAEERVVREAKLEEIANGLRVQGVDVAYSLVEGHAAAEILRVAQAVNADCIVMATHGRTGFSHAWIGSVAERVVRASLCPVLTVRGNLPVKQDHTQL